MEIKSYRKKVISLQHSIHQAHILRAIRPKAFIPAQMHEIAAASEIAAVQATAIADLLIEKGILTVDEVHDTILRALQNTVMAHENELSDRLKKTIRLDMVSSS